MLTDIFLGSKVDKTLMSVSCFSWGNIMMSGVGGENIFNGGGNILPVKIKQQKSWNTQHLKRKFLNISKHVNLSQNVGLCLVTIFRNYLPQRVAYTCPRPRIVSHINAKKV